MLNFQYSSFQFLQDWRVFFTFATKYSISLSFATSNIANELNTAASRLLVGLLQAYSGVWLEYGWKENGARVKTQNYLMEKK